ncbi:MAG TPA: EamA family transporter [Bryobacteraceae bacterium]|jgi:drug/metabolite transporter (DMT)-like permease
MKWVLAGIIMMSNASADLLNTTGMRRHGGVEDFRPRGVARLLAALAKNRFVLGGIASDAVGFFTLMSLLSIANVSFAVPATAGSLVLETLLAKLILKEDVRWQRWFGAVVVACGVALLALP